MLNLYHRMHPQQQWASFASRSQTEAEQASVTARHFPSQKHASHTSLMYLPCDPDNGVCMPAAWGVCGAFLRSNNLATNQTRKKCAITGHVQSPRPPMSDVWNHFPLLSFAMFKGWACLSLLIHVRLSLLTCDEWICCTEQRV